MKKKQRHILFVMPYPKGVAPSQRFRFEQYFSALDKRGIRYTLAPFLSVRAWSILYKPGKKIQKIYYVFRGYIFRFLLLGKLSRFDIVCIHREASPIGPPLFEYLITQVFKKKVVYDFDDAIWLSNTSEHNRWISRLKWHQKVGHICKWSYKVSCGNTYLLNYAKLYQPNSFINPTTIDLIHHHNKTKNQETKPIVIGWTGTHSTISYLNTFIPILDKLEKKNAFEFLIISNKPLPIQRTYIRQITWNKDREIEDLLQMHIGVMPLSEDKWSLGKCGFKALQYMALGIPAIVSPIGVNTDIVTEGVDGYLCRTDAEWIAALEELLVDTRKRIQMGIKAKEKIKKHYSTESNEVNFCALFDEKS